MSERNPDCKRDAEFEASSTRVSPLKKTKLDDSTRDVISAVSASSVASSADSAPDGRCSVTSAGEDDDQSSSLSSGGFSGETDGIARNSPSFGVDLETHQIAETESETEKSTLITSNFRKERNPESEALGETTEMESSSATERDDARKPRGVSKIPTQAEVEGFFLGLGNDDKQKRFIEKYNFDIVNDKPLEGRYKWDPVKP